MEALLAEVRQCVVCESELPMGCRPVLAAHPKSRILIIGQAPGRIVHASGIPFDDRSGDNLRRWLGVDRPTFYSPQQIAILPMGFCFPGTGKSGDLPPRPECAPLWHERILQQMPHLELTLLLGNYAQRYYLGNQQRNLTETVRHYKDYWPRFLPLPHPSPRNNRWFKKNPWFESEIIPCLQKRVTQLLNL
jgi:uracil-DNA glycosylase